MTKKFDIHVLTQYRENYGDALAPYWKSKGGSTYVLAGLELALSDGIGAAAQAVVDAHRASIVDWELAEAGALTDDEKTQIKYGYGRVDFPSKRIAVR